jgi:hypothetical protein
MKYLIKSFDEKTGTMLVEYFTDDDKSITNLAIDIPIVDGQYLNAVAINALILERSPSWVVARHDETALADASHILEMVTVGATGEPTIRQLREGKKKLINQYREIVLDHGVDYNGNTFDSDPLSVSRLNTVANMVNAGVALPFDFKWRAKNNVDIDFEASDVLALLCAMIERADYIFKRSWTAKAAVDAATTRNDIAAVTWVEPGILASGVTPEAIIEVRRAPGWNSVPLEELAL